MTCPTTDLDPRWCGCGKHRKATTPLPSIVAPAEQRRRAAGRSKTHAKVFAQSSQDDDMQLCGRFMPAGFFDYYARLLEAEFGGRGLGSFSAPDPEMKVASGAQPDEMVVIRSERALWARYKLDRKIKRLVADMHNALVDLDSHSANTSKPLKRKCSGRCGKFGDPDHLYCPWCGGPMHDTDLG